MKNVDVKVVLLGDSGVGKSSLVYRFVMNSFNENQVPTIGAAFMAKNYVHNNANYKFQIWDTAGQEKYHSLASLYYRDAQAAIIVFDINNIETYQNMKQWTNEVLLQGNQNTSFYYLLQFWQLLPINVTWKPKRNLIYRIQRNSPKQLIFLKEKNAFFIKTSSKNNVGIEDIFIHFSNQIQLQSNDQEDDDSIQQKDNKINKITVNYSKSEKKCTC